MPDCACDRCQRACQHRPGWFAPGQVESVAQHLGLSLAEVFTRYLAVDWLWSRVKGQYLFALAPRLQHAPGGSEYPAEPTGVCMFFKDGQCTIHAVKPAECRAMTHLDSADEISARKWSLAYAWQAGQEQLRQLLGRLPVAAAPTPAQVELEARGMTR